MLVLLAIVAPIVVGKFGMTQSGITYIVAAAGVGVLPAGRGRRGTSRRSGWSRSSSACPTRST